MDNEGFEDDGNLSLKQLDDVESQSSNSSGYVSRATTMDFYRTASVTKHEEQITFAWENISVKTKPKSGRKFCKRSEPLPSKTIVHQTSGYVRPGELVAIMGASGAGKSTLLNALTSRYSSTLDVTGERYVNGNLVNPRSLTAVSAYIMQDDLFIGSLTPREHLQFMAKVRMGEDISTEKRKERIEAVIKELGLTKSQHTQIGIPGRVKGISGGESKRLAFASEILTNPPLLFCDEPTSGLDAFMAQNVVGVLRSLARQGKSIICTIHQPSSEVFAMFGKVHLMAEGQLAYSGDTESCYRFFAECGYPCPEKYNPSDHYVHTLAIVPGDEEKCRKRVKTITSQFQESEEGKDIQEVVEHEKSHRKSHPTLAKQEMKPTPYRASWCQQFLALLQRAWISALKNPQVLWVTLIQTLALGLIIGTVFLHQDYDQEGVQNIMGAIFITITCVSYVYQFSVINTFCLELPVLLREHFNGAYRVDVYYITKQLAELPIFLVLPVILSTLIYWMVGLNEEFERFLTFVAIILLLAQVVTSFGYLISSCAGDVQLALAVAPPLMIPSMMFGGFLINLDTVPSWLSWIQYISWFFYTNELAMVNQWEGVDDIECEAELDQLACPFKTGEDVLTVTKMKESRFTQDILILLAMVAIFKIGGLLALIARTRRRN